ncbi:MAG: excinuclease ABC subunit C [Alphaproteobacteria bacterium CG11_big_fil_rev_8_21_14_0_20_39_49]|nr:MAG: excinuclease ABC subunit C [Alphaproteobacteria bacterium CG11_big_fil_rev_8_21_14_0_20_39_49]
MEKLFTVYIISNRKNGILYTGITSNLQKRVWEHKNKVIDGFSKKYNLNNLIYYEPHANAENAIKREKRLKKYKREQKIKLIEKENPNWEDLYEKLF